MEEENKTKQNKTKNPENSTELQKLNIDTEAYNNNKNMTEYTHIHIHP